MKDVLTSLNRKKQYKYPYLFLGLYLTLLLSTVCLASRLTLIGTMLEPGGIFVFPLTFCICDIVGEVYGYAYPRLFIWVGIIFEFIFSLIVIIVSHLPYPDFFTQFVAYQTVFDPTIRYVCSGLIGLLVGEFANIYFLAKWKILTAGKFFKLRSLISTAIGQATLTFIVDILNYYGTITGNHLIWMMVCGFMWKMGFAIIFIFPSWIIVNKLKKLEKVDHYDIHTNFNPFTLDLQEESSSDSILNSSLSQNT